MFVIYYTLLILSNILLVYNYTNVFLSTNFRISYLFILEYYLKFKITSEPLFFCYFRNKCINNIVFIRTLNR